MPVQQDDAPVSAIERLVTEHYRCPSGLVDLPPPGSWPQDANETDLGLTTACDGASSRRLMSTRPTGPLDEALNAVLRAHDGACFTADPGEIVDNLRSERYTGDDCGRGSSRLIQSRPFRNLYYRLRALLPVHLRKHLQKAYLRGWNKIAFPRWPVDTTVDWILERLLELPLQRGTVRAVPFIWFWPDGATSAVSMTHDVEHLAGRNFCSRLMDLDDSVGIKSSFELVPEGRYSLPETFLEEIRTRGFEINVHDLNHDGRLFSSHAAFLQRVGRINSYGKRYRALGFRSGGLYRNQAWYDALDFSYDMSVPNTAHLDPQRGGCCTIMPFFVGRVLELPLTTSQDYSLFHILNDYSIDLWKQQLRLIMERHGLATFLVHPDYIIEKRARKTYQALLEHLTRLREEKRLWIALPGEVDSWWRKRRRMSIVQEGGKWAIRGPGSARARLAFATLNDDGLSFTVEGR